MKFRVAVTEDIPQIMDVRLCVRENRLSDPGRITEADYTKYMLNRGRGWVCELEGKILGFAIVDFLDNNVWALFVDPSAEKIGIGKRLHDMMLDWYFSCSDSKLFLFTEPGTRAEGFYLKAGWVPVGIKKSGDIIFCMEKTCFQKTVYGNDHS